MEHATFETERLILRPTHEADSDLVFRLMNTPKWLQYIGDRNIRSVADARGYIQERMLPQLQRLGYSNYTVVRRQDHQKIGSCGLYDRDGIQGIDLGFAFLPEYENQGYGFEAASRLMQAAFHDFGLERLSAITTADNRASQRLLEKLGLIRIGTVTLPASHEALVLYQLEREGWLSPAR
jgi:RimJ/RimL family protein N-acetyltransferase